MQREFPLKPGAFDASRCRPREARLYPEPANIGSGSRGGAPGSHRIRHRLARKIPGAVGAPHAPASHRTLVRTLDSVEEKMLAWRLRWPLALVRERVRFFA